MNMKTEEILLRTSLQDCREKYDKLSGKYLELQAENARLMEELAAAQATIEQMREALTEVVDADECQDADGWLCFELSAEAYHRADAALALQCNQDALHEARALECEHISAHCHNKNWGIMADMLTKRAAAHRAKKGEGK